MLIRLVSIALAASIAGCSGCGDDAPANPDGGEVRGVRLVAVGSASVGLAFGESRTLRVQYEYDNREVITGAQIGFTILESATGDPGGATLTATSATTDGLGVATVDVVAGAARANFRIRASADGAAPVYFYVAVSQDGFATITARPTHQGRRLASTFDRVELRLYLASEVDCASLDVDDPPDAVTFPAVSNPGFGPGLTAVFEAVSANMDYTLAGWGQVVGSDTRVAVGCVDLDRSTITPGAAELLLAVADRPAVLPPAATLASSILLTPLADELALSPAGAPWRALACPAGPGQLIADCTIDALETDGALDCVVNSVSPRALALAATRGAPNAAGCRPAANPAVTLDKELTDAVVAGGSFPTGAALSALLAAQSDTLELLELSSTLSLDAGAGTLAHRLDTARLTVAGADYDVVLGDTARPVVRAAPVVWSRSGADELVIADHGFTLRVGSLARAGFRDVGLAAAGLDDREADLGAALMESASDTASSTTDCAAVSAIVCDRLGEAAGCALAACNAAAAHLDVRFGAWWQALDGSGLDLSLSGLAPIRDHDDDLVADSVGVGESGQDGGWSASFTTASGAAVSSSGSFGSTSFIPRQR